MRAAIVVQLALIVPVCGQHCYTIVSVCTHFNTATHGVELMLMLVLLPLSVPWVSWCGLVAQRCRCRGCRGMDAVWLSTGVCLGGGTAWPMSRADLLCVPMLRHNIVTTLQHNDTQHPCDFYIIDAGRTVRSEAQRGTAPLGGGWT